VQGNWASILRSTIKGGFKKGLRHEKSRALGWVQRDFGKAGRFVSTHVLTADNRPPRWISSVSRCPGGICLRGGLFVERHDFIADPGDFGLTRSGSARFDADWRRRRGISNSEQRCRQCRSDLGSSL
jgi:hypothetical protein